MVQTMVDDILDTLCNDLNDCASSRLRDSIAQIALPGANETKDILDSKVRSLESNSAPGK